MTQAAGHPTMSFGDAILAGFRQYAEFGGRAGVAEFWWFILFVTLVTSGLGALNVATPNGVIGVGSSLASLWVIGTMIPTLAAGVRRLRDAGRRWTELFWLLIPIAGLIVMAIRMSEPSKPQPGGSPQAFRTTTGS